MWCLWNKKGKGGAIYDSLMKMLVWYIFACEKYNSVI